MERFWLVACGVLLGWSGAGLMDDVHAPFDRIWPGAMLEPLRQSFLAIAAGVDAYEARHVGAREMALAQGDPLAIAGVPGGARRLGELRRECRRAASAGVIMNATFLLSTLRRSSAADCDAFTHRHYWFYADKAIFNVTLQDGVRRKSISTQGLYGGCLAVNAQRAANDFCQNLQARSYALPLWDRTWSDDTVVRLEYMDEPASGREIDVRLDPSGIPVALVTGETTGADMLAYARPERRLRMQNGFESWLYAVKPRGDAGGAPADLVVLIGPDGVVRKARVRQPSADS